MLMVGLFLLLAASAALAAKPISVSRTLLIGDVPYYLPSEPLLSLGDVKISTTDWDVIPIALFSGNESRITSEYISAQIDRWTGVDSDVFSDEFLQGKLMHII